MLCWVPRTRICILGPPMLLLVYVNDLEEGVASKIFKSDDNFLE